MRTTVTLRDDAYEIAVAVAWSMRKSLGDLLGDLVLGDMPRRDGADKIAVDKNGSPSIDLGRIVTHEEAKKDLEQD